MKKLKTMIIENNPERALFYEACGVDRIFIDLEIMGKKERQGHLDTFISKHKLDDLEKIRSCIQKAEILTRVNPINPSSKNEINDVINSGTDVVMLPMFKNNNEVKKFVGYVDGRAKVNLLFETPQSVQNLESILSLDGIDEIHIGLNDLHLGMKLKFMFQLLESGFIDSIVKKIRPHSIPFGIGGVATIDGGAVSGNLIIQEYARLGSEFVILSRAFKKSIKDCNFKEELKKIIHKYNQYPLLGSNQRSLIQNELYDKINIVVRHL